jgi:hypothetical protein
MHAKNLVLVLSIIVAMLFLTSGAGATVYERQMNLNVSSGSAPSGYQVRLLLNNANMGANYNWTLECVNNYTTRTRFLNSTTKAELPFFVDECSVAEKYMVVFVKIDNAITTSNYPIIISYNNPARTATSDGYAVFDFFDGFETFNTGTWYNVFDRGISRLGVTTFLNTSSMYINLSSYAGTKVVVQSLVATFGMNVSLYTKQYRQDTASDDDIEALFMTQYNLTNDNVTGIYSESSNWRILEAINDGSSFYVPIITSRQNDAWFSFRTDRWANYDRHTIWKNATMVYNYSGTTSFRTLQDLYVVLGGFSNANVNPDITWTDWVGVSKFYEYEPRYAIGAETYNQSEVDQCGNLNITNNVYYLKNDVSSTATCFTILADNVTLDCQNHAINYNSVSVGYGVRDNSYDSATIKNCNIIQTGATAGSYGIYFSETYNSIIDNNSITTKSSVYGIQIDTAPNNSLIMNNRMNMMAIDGEYFNITNNNFNSSCPYYQIGYVADGYNDTYIIGNNFNGGNGIQTYGYNYDEKNINIIGNVMRTICSSETAISFDYAVTDITVLNNYIDGFETGVDINYGINVLVKNNFLNLTGVPVYGLKLSGTNQTADNNTFFIYSSFNAYAPLQVTSQANINNTYYSGNAFAGVFGLDTGNSTIENMLSTNYKSIYVYAGTAGIVNFINATTNETDITFAGAGTLQFNFYRYLNLIVRASSGSPLYNASVNIKDLSNSTIFSGYTDVNGRIPRQLIHASMRNYTNTIYNTPHTILVEKTGYISNSTSVNMNDNKNLSLTLTLQPPPVVIIDHPENGDVHAGTIPMEATITSVGTISTAYYELTNGSGIVLTGNLTAPYDWNWNSSGYADGNYTYTVFATDQYGSSNASVTSGIDNTNPLIHVHFPNNVNLTASFNLDIYVTNMNLNYSYVNITYPNGSVFYVNASFVGANEIHYTDYINMVGQPYGNYTVYILGIDHLMQEVTAQKWFLYYETNSPQYSGISVTTPPVNIPQGDTLLAQFNITVTDQSPLSYVKLNFGGTDYTVTPNGNLYSYALSLTCGTPKTYYWKMADIYGNTNQTSDYAFTLACQPVIFSMPLAGAVVIVIAVGGILSIIGLNFDFNGDPTKYIEALIGTVVIVTILAMIFTAV